MAALAFVSGFQPKATLDLLTKKSLKGVPRSPGVYLLMASETSFHYPGGSSPVFYIGQGKNVRRRLQNHRRWIAKAKATDRKLCLYRCRHE